MAATATSALSERLLTDLPRQRSMLPAALCLLAVFGFHLRWEVWVSDNAVQAPTDTFALQSVLPTKTLQLKGPTRSQFQMPHRNFPATVHNGWLPGSHFFPRTSRYCCLAESDDVPLSKIAESDDVSLSKIATFDSPHPTNPIFDVAEGDPSRFDSAALGGLWIEPPAQEGGTWRMYYHGRSLTESGNIVKLSMGSIGMAESRDGFQWVRLIGKEAGGAVFGPSINDPESFDSALVGMGSIVGDRLYYFGGSQEPFTINGESVVGGRQRIGVAFWDGTTWTDRRQVLDVGPEGSFDSTFVASPQVVQHGPDDWRMYYFGAGKGFQGFRIGLATSTDGLTWERQGVVISPGEDGAWDAAGCSRHNVFRRGDGGYGMLYEGVSTDGRHSFGLAISEDGIRWKKDGAVPAFGSTASDTAWDGKGVSGPRYVAMPKGQARLYYIGTSPERKTAVGVSVGDNTSMLRWFIKIASMVAAPV
eukprot:gnl/TRDRNA2_/TRDRNA2_167267_c1_seq2.p1 gnl/TRDRNA2_/TRDRNA2_167267_c1~~gnl/TRDRNA2_/TRDRNA2_167267_c1_seq2.p1  ORF type:complete len:475 (-),score=59.74 gnl/TRDRNA2_/TRDRNA2_167267_c1_seq2:59-1483(-)